MIEVAYEGSCDKCKTMICPFYGTCVDNGGLDAKCVCQETCSDDVMPFSNQYRARILLYSFL